MSVSWEMSTSSLARKGGEMTSGLATLATLEASEVGLALDMLITLFSGGFGDSCRCSTGFNSSARWGATLGAHLVRPPRKQRC